MTNKIFIIGSGGHCRPITECAIDLGYEIQAIIDVNKKSIKKTEKILGVTVKSKRELEKLKKNTKVFLAIGNNEIRSKYFKKKNKVLNFINLIHPSAYISKNIKIGKGNFIGPRVIINTKAQISNNCIINTSSIIEHEVKIFDNVHIAPGSIICGRARIHKNTFIGAGSIIFDNLKIGTNVKIGAGSVLKINATSNSLYFGVPAKIKKK